MYVQFRSYVKVVVNADEFFGKLTFPSSKSFMQNFPNNKDLSDKW